MREERKRETEKRESWGSTDKWAPPPRGVHVSKPALQNRRMAKSERFLIVGWSKIPGFGVQWPKSNSGNSRMVKNGLFPLEHPYIVEKLGDMVVVLVISILT